MTASLRFIAWAIMSLLALGIGLVSFRYLLPHVPMGAPNVLANLFARPFLAVHAGAAALALVIGPFQFIRSKSGRRPAWHRVSGPAYVAACLIAAPAGLVLAVGSSAGPVAGVGFGLLAVTWFYVNLRGLQAVLQGRYAEHGRWMIRSYALTFAAVTLRLYLPLGPMLLGLDFMTTYRATAWISWIPNLLIVEAVLSRRPRLTTTAPA
jgi:uncharacterized membrane protein